MGMESSALGFLNVLAIMTLELVWALFDKSTLVQSSHIVAISISSRFLDNVLSFVEVSKRLFKSVNMIVLTFRRRMADRSCARART